MSLSNIKILFSVLFLTLVNQNYSQVLYDTLMFQPDQSGLIPKMYEKGVSNLSVSGYYRFLGNYTSMQTQYPEFEGINNRVFLGDDSNLPQLSMTLGLSPSKNTSFSTDLYLWTPMTGRQDDYVKGLLLGVNLTGKHATDFGSFTVRTGGIHWHKLSPLTFATNTGYNRYSLFERNPWDPNTKDVFDRYDTFYNNGALTQDVRWGQQAFQGIIIDADDLPKGMSASIMHGKSQLNGGAAPTPNSLSGLRIKKDLTDAFISLNAVHNNTYADSISNNLVGFNMITSEFEIKGEHLTYYGEVGGGNYFSPIHTGSWGEVIDVKVVTKKSLTKFPLELRYFRVSPNVLNNNGIFWNTSIQEYNNQNQANIDNGQAPLLFPFASSLTQIGQMTNNRQGLILNTDLQFGSHKVTIGYSIAQELEAISDRITYGHPANNLALSRFWRWGFPTAVGPYNNISKIYRGVYETVGITDAVTAKGFNSLEVSYKNSVKLFNRELMLFYLGGFYSVQQQASILPQFNLDSYLQSFNHQVEFYYALSKNVAWCNYFGYDRIYAGVNTERDIESNGTKNQEGFSLATGLDIELTRGAGLYIRQRWFNYQDYNFSLDQYKGFETTVELKIFF